MSPLAVVLMVVGIFALVVGINLAVWIPVIRRLRRMPDQLREELAGEAIVRGPERASYRGATGGYSKAGSIGVAVLTERRLIFRKPFGAPIEVPRGEIASVRDARVFRRSVAAGRTHTIVKLTSGAELGFYFADAAAWEAALREPPSA